MLFFEAVAAFGTECGLKVHFLLAMWTGGLLSRRRVVVFIEPLAAFGTEGKILGHFLLALRTDGLRGRRELRLRRILERILILLGQLRAGLAHLGDELAQGGRVLRQFLRAKEDKGQNREDDEFLETYAKHSTILDQPFSIRWPQ
jgi:hypothetical protein